MKTRALLLTLALFATSVLAPTLVHAEADEEIIEQIGWKNIDTEQMLGMLNCAGKMLQNKGWLNMALENGLLLCLRPGDENTSYYELEKEFKRTSGISFYLDQPQDDDVAEPDEDYTPPPKVHYNPKFLAWLNAQLDMVLNDPMLYQAAKPFFQSQRDVARSFVFAHECLERRGDVYDFAAEWSQAAQTDKDNDYDTTVEHEYTGELLKMCLPYYDGSFETFAASSNSNVKLSMTFWLRRTVIDGTAHELWALLGKVMEEYDQEWFKTRGMKEPEGSMRGPYQYCGPNGEDYEEYYLDIYPDDDEEEGI